MLDNRGRLFTRLVRLALGTLFIAACSASVPSPSAPPQPTTAVTTTPASASRAAATTAASPTVASGTVTIEMAEHFYSPSFLTVRVGTTVVWKVVGVQSHDVHARDGSFNSSLMAPGNTFTYTFTKAGKFPYYCAPHEGDGMTGEIDVVN